MSQASKIIPTNESVVSQIRHSSFRNRSSGGNVEASNRPERCDENLVGTFFGDPRNSTLLHMNTAPPAFNPGSDLNFSDHNPSSNVSTPSPFLRADK